MARLITVAVPTLDRPSLLPATVRSVLRQSYPQIELVVVDNGSAKPASSVLSQIEDRRLRVARYEETVPMESNWNRGLSQAQGELFLLLSDDDLLLPNALRLLETPLRDPTLAFVYGGYVEVDSAGRPTGRRGPAGPLRESGEEFIQGKLSEDRGIMPSGLLLRTVDARRVGGYPPVGTATDLGLALALATRGDVACVPAPVVQYRRHSEALSMDVSHLIRSHLELIAWALEEESLRDHADPITGYVRAWFLGQAAERGTMGDRPGRDTFFHAAAQLGAPTHRIWRIRAMTSPPARVVREFLGGALRKQR